MKSAKRILAVTLCLILIMAMSVSSVSAQDPYRGSATSLRGNNNSTHTFYIVGASSGSVWGTDVYTDDSIIARAAVHFGLVGVGEAANVTIRILPGRDSYTGTTRYGVTTSSYGKWNGSYEFVAAAPPPTVSEGTFVDGIQMGVYENYPYDAAVMIMPDRTLYIDADFGMGLDTARGTWTAFVADDSYTYISAETTKGNFTFFYDNGGARTHLYVEDGSLGIIPVDTAFTFATDWADLNPTSTPPPTEPPPTEPSPPAPPPPAQDSNAPSGWAQPQVNYSGNLGLVPSALQSDYRQALTRAEFAALAVTLYEGELGVITGDLPTFSDTSDINVRKAAKVGIAAGVGGGNFNPNGELTREMAAVMLAQLSDALGQPLPNSPATFADSGSIASWALIHVGRVQAAGIMSGVGGNLFAPNGSYTREQGVITMLKSYERVREIWPGRYVCDLGMGDSNPYIDIWTHEFDFVPGGGDGPFMGFFLVGEGNALFIDELDGTPFLFTLGEGKLIYDTDYNAGLITKGHTFILTTRSPGQELDNVSAARARTPVIQRGAGGSGGAGGTGDPEERTPDKPWREIDVPAITRMWTRIGIIAQNPPETPRERINIRTYGSTPTTPPGGGTTGGGTVTPGTSPDPEAPPTDRPPREPPAGADTVIEIWDDFELPPPPPPYDAPPTSTGEQELINLILSSRDVRFTGTRTADFGYVYSYNKVISFLIEGTTWTGWLPPTAAVKREAAEISHQYFLSAPWSGDETAASLHFRSDGTLNLTAERGPEYPQSTTLSDGKSYTYNESATAINQTFTPEEFSYDIHYGRLNAANGGIYGSAPTGGQIVVGGYDLSLTLYFNYETGKIHGIGNGFSIGVQSGVMRYSDFEFVSEQSYLDYLP
ncbi:MAG: LCCL domain-containing protein [Oscillospiraceae bacterium]|nr:LCCL domain-containing protein [Oscillospiraceae bacterium]